MNRPAPVSSLLRLSKPLAALAALALAGCAHAAVAPPGSRSCHDVTLPETVEVAAHTLRLNGMAVRDVTIFDVDVYVGALYLETPTSDAPTVIASEQSKRIVLRFIREVTRQDIVNAWESGFVNNAGTERLGLVSEIAAFEALFADVNEGDEMLFDYVPGTGLTYSHNGTVRGTIAGSAFAQAFFMVFVGSAPPSEALKSGLLGGRCD